MSNQRLKFATRVRLNRNLAIGETRNGSRLHVRKGQEGTVSGDCAQPRREQITFDVLGVSVRVDVLTAFLDVVEPAPRGRES